MTKYNLGYYENMLRMYSATAEKINKIRWEWIRSHCNPLTVLDYGCGVGWFRAFRPETGLTVNTFDIGEFPQTGIRLSEYDLICFWDVLEHLPSFDVIEELLDKAQYVAATVPIVPERRSFDLRKWKHFKPGEHLHYWTSEMVIDMFEAYGYKLVTTGTPECPPRQDVHSFLFERRDHDNGT
jgi:hypothetical protein